MQCFLRQGFPLAPIRHNRMWPNSALLTDTYTSPLRAQVGAAKRER
jgi:hypothetical protein